MSAAPPDEFAVAATAPETLATAQAELSVNDDERLQLRRKMAVTELRLAVRDLQQGLRGMIRVSPLLSVATAALIGAAWSRRGRRRQVRR